MLSKLVKFLYVDLFLLSLPVLVNKVEYKREESIHIGCVAFAYAYV